MSYDMSIGDEEFNYTYNVSEMWYDCYDNDGIRKHYNLKGEDAIPILKTLQSHMIHSKERLEKMNPRNGWGSYEGALNFVNDLIEASKRNPNEYWTGD